MGTAEDTTDEADETFTVTLSGPTNATLGDGTGTGTIADDDGAPSLSVADAAAAEGSDVSFTVTLSAASGKPVTVRYDTSRPVGTTAEAADFTAQTNRTLTIPAGATTGTIAVPTANDTIDEDDETFRLTLSSPTNATLATADATATGTISGQPVLRGPVVVNVEVLPPRKPALDLARGYGYSPEQLSSNVLARLPQLDPLFT